MMAAFPLWRARGPRFLFLLLLFWVLLRVTALTSAPDRPEMARKDQFATNDPAMLDALASSGSVGTVGAKLKPVRYGVDPIGTAPGWRVVAPRPIPAGSSASTPPVLSEPVASSKSLWSTSERHRWRFAKFEQWLGAQRPRTSAAFMTARPQYPSGQAATVPPPVWPTKPDQRWSLSLFSYWRGNGAGLPQPLGNRPQTLGGSQSAARLDYAFDDSGRTRLFVRLTTTPATPVQTDASIGVAFRPVRSLPVDVIAEQRFPLTAMGSEATLVYVAGGVDDVPVPAGFVLSAYAQGGLVRTTSTRAFVDAAIAVEYPLASQDGVRLSAGAMAAGAVQPGGRRVDVGPRATLRLTEVGQGARLSLDWRTRVAGEAAPASGLALTLATGF